jgi:hypothetical protein
MQVLKQLQIIIFFTDALAQMLTYIKLLNNILSNKRSWRMQKDTVESELQRDPEWDTAA